jgi:hypothetical protein
MNSERKRTKFRRLTALSFVLSAMLSISLTVNAQNKASQFTQNLVESLTWIKTLGATGSVAVGASAVLAAAPINEMNSAIQKANEQKFKNSAEKFQRLWGLYITQPQFVSRTKKLFKEAVEYIHKYCGKDKAQFEKLTGLEAISCEHGSFWFNTERVFLSQLGVSRVFQPRSNGAAQLPVYEIDPDQVAIAVLYPQETLWQFQVEELAYHLVYLSTELLGSQSAWASRVLKSYSSDSNQSVKNWKIARHKVTQALLPIKSYMGANLSYEQKLEKTTTDLETKTLEKRRSYILGDFDLTQTELKYRAHVFRSPSGEAFNLTSACGVPDLRDLFYDLISGCKKMPFSKIIDPQAIEEFQQVLKSIKLTDTTYAELAKIVSIQLVTALVTSKINSFFRINELLSKMPYGTKWIGQLALWQSEAYTVSTIAKPFNSVEILEEWISKLSEKERGELQQLILRLSESSKTIGNLKTSQDRKNAQSKINSIVVQIYLLFYGKTKVATQGLEVLDGLKIKKKLNDENQYF